MADKACASSLGNSSECFHDTFQRTGPGRRSETSCLTASVEFGQHFDSLLAVTQRLAAGKSVRIVTLGGSVPYGNNCIRPNGEHHRSCSWPARLVHTLRSAYPASAIAHDNLASGGNGVVHILSTLGIVLRESTDLILLDSLVNDAWRSGSVAASQALEALIRTARALAPSAALLVVEAAAPGLGDEIQQAKRRVLEHYHIATLDWKSAAQASPSLWRPGPIAGTRSTDVNHPSWITHQMIADNAAALWGRAARRACRRGAIGGLSVQTPSAAAIAGTAAVAPLERYWPQATLWRAAELSNYDVCTRPLSVYTSVGGGGSGDGDGGGSNVGIGSPSKSHGWRFFADRPNKYGWIATEVGARIGFELHFGAAPRFCLTYLRSYERVGRIQLAIPAIGFRAELDALWSDRASQSDVLWFGTTQGHDMTISYNTMHVAGLMPNSTHTIEARLLDTPTREGGNKFKILQLVSC